MSLTPVVALRDVAIIQRDSIQPIAIQANTPYVGLENIQPGGDLVGVRGAQPGELASSKFVFTPKHLLYGKLRPYLAKVARPDFEGICSTDILPVLPGPSLDRSYLAHFLLRPESVAWAASRATGANLPRLSPRALAEMAVPLPSLPEQRRIAEVLDRADALRAKRRAALAQLDTLAQSIFLDMFGDPVTNPRRWPLARFGSLCDRVTVGVVVKPASYYVSSGVPALRSLNVKPGKVVLDDLVYFSKQINDTTLRKSKLRAGDLVLVRSGQPGTAAVVPPELDGVNAIDLLIATPSRERTDAAFLCAFFGSSGGQNLVLASQRGQIQKHLNAGSLNRAPVPVPPLRLQKEFARRIASVDDQTATSERSLANLNRLFASLQQRAFSGQL